MNKKGLGKFAAGALIGAGIGVLIAPKKGSETRKDIKNKTGEVIDKVKKTKPEDVKKVMGQKIKELKKDLENLDKETVIEAAKDKASKIAKKCDELIDVAKEKSMPVIEATANELKSKTITILKNATAKLENSENQNAKKTTKKVTKTTKKKA